jgi:DNA-binding transcriptional ArsR family regulator
MLSLDQSPMIALVAARLRALADETRLKLLLALRQKPRPVSDLALLLAIPQPSISKHLAVLKTAGLVDCQRSANQVFYRIADQRIFEMCALVCDGVTRHIQAQNAALETRPTRSSSPRNRKGIRT